MRIPPGTEHEVVKEAQASLAEAGFELEATTGVLDQQTQNKLAAYQIEHDLEATGALDEQTIQQLGIDVAEIEKVPTLEDERAEFRSLIATNPNYFGTQPEVDAEAVEVIEADTSYESLECVGYEPETERLEAVVHVHRSYGYLGGICSSGSPEYVRFYLDEDNTGNWTDVGMVHFTAYDIPGDKPLEYGVSLQIDPEEDFCHEENLPTVRAILSWNKAPPANSPNHTPVWGNVVESRIQIDPLTLFPFEHFLDQFELAVPEPLLEGIDLSQSLSFEPAALTDASLAETYAETSVPPHRFGFSKLTTAIEDPAIGDALDPAAETSPFSEAILDFDFDLGEIVEGWFETSGDTYYEELGCVGFTGQGLNAVLTLKRPNGYSGGLCSAGSDEYVAFWEWDPTASQWDHLGTTAVNVHDIQNMPGDGLQYAAFLPATLSDRQQPCADGASTARIRATLSWEQPPPPSDPYWTPTWGNSMETLVHVPPGPTVEPGETQAYVDTIGSMAPCDIAQPSGLASGADSSTLGGFTAKQSPFGGTVVVTGTILNPPASLGSAAPIEYRVRVRPMNDSGTAATGPWQSVKTTFRVRVTEKVGSGPPVSYWRTQEPDEDGYYEYLPDPSPEPWRYVPSDVLTEWHTGDREGKWQIKLQTREPGGEPVDADAKECATGGTRSSVVIELDNTRPEASMSITHVTPAGGSKEPANECGKFQRTPGATSAFPMIGDTIHGSYEAWDDNILSLNFRLEPTDHVNTAAISPSDKSFTVSETGESGTWKLDTTGMDSCGFVGRLRVRDRTIVNSRNLGWRRWDEVGFCLLEPAETDGGSTVAVEQPAAIDGEFEFVEGHLGDYPIEVKDAQFDTPGDDHEHLNEEYVSLENVGHDAVDLGGWRIEDDAGHVFEFPLDFSLEPGASVTVRSGSGEDGESELYWGSERAIWDNTGDSVFLYDDAGSLVLKRSY